MEYEVVWDGSHRNSDADLLFAGVRRAQQVPAEALPMQPATSIAKVPVLEVLPLDRDQAMTIGELMARTGSTYGSVSQALYRLLDEGMVASAIQPGHFGSGRPRKLFWRKVAGA